MKLKKINAAVALLTALLLALHNTLNACMMLLGRVNESPTLLAYLLIGLFGVHALISLSMSFIKAEGKGIRYLNVSKGWFLQRMTALVMIPLVVFHGFVSVGQLGFGLMPILVVHFFVMLAAYIHIPLSVPNALVTLGMIDGSKQHAAARRVCWIICALLFLLGLTASISEVIAL